MSHLFCLASFLAASTVAASLASAQAVISIDPTAQTTSTGQAVTVDVAISNVSDLYGFQFDLGYNPGVLKPVSSTEGSFLATGGSTYFLPGTNDPLGGTVLATADTLLSAINGVNGSGELAVFAFDAIGAGTSTFVIKNENLLNSGLNVISDLSRTALVTVHAPTGAPELEAASIGAPLSLLLGCLAVMHGRREVGDWQRSVPGRS